MEGKKEESPDIKRMLLRREGFEGEKSIPGERGIGRDIEFLE